ncbi:MAG: translation initiation factor IF-2 [Prevotellaceae bacterium]|jgi:translation initiation factor IF-2|nr:translation initiation factor IF-2 [Prevotellaceae bacterium]
MARLGQIMKTLNIGLITAADFLKKKGNPIEENPNVKLTEIQENILISEFSKDKNMKEQADKLIKQRQEKQKQTTIAVEGYEDETVKKEPPKKAVAEEIKHEKKIVAAEEKPVETIEAKAEQIQEIAEKHIEIEQKKEEKPEPKPERIAERKTEQKPEQPVEQKLQAKPQQSIQKPPKEVAAEKKTEQKKDNQQQKQSQKQNNQQRKNNEQKKDKPEQQQQQPKLQQAAQVETDKKEPEIFKHRIPVLEAKPNILGKIDLNNVVDGVVKKPLSRKERKQKYREMERQKREAERIIKNQQQRQKQKEEQKERDSHHKEERDRQQTQRLKNPVITAKDLKKPEFMPTITPPLKGVSVKGKIELSGGSDKNHSDSGKKKKKRKRIGSGRIEVAVEKDNLENKPTKSYKKQRNNKEISKVAVNQNVKETLARLNEGRKFNKKGVKYRHDKREAISEKIQEQQNLELAESKILKITEFITANELAVMMNVSVNDVIKTYMSLGMFIGINQRLDAETINIVAEEFGFKIQLVSAEISNAIKDEEVDKEEDLLPRSPVVTVMGHVDHGKTSLLDYIRKTNVIAGEAGGITQHIGAYNVTLEDGRHITFLDTPGHSAFTAMRARGAKVTDIAIIVVAADDNVMPQTIEAINHASAAGVPIVFAINKIDKDGADPEKIKATLANMNYLVESWGGKYQSQDISAKKGIGVKELMGKVLLEAELLDLKANPKRKAQGSVIEFTKDKGRGNVATLLVSNGTLKVGDIVVVGYAYGRIRAMFNERNQKINEAKPAEPVMILGLKGELQAGDNFNIMETEQEARNIVSQREQLKREQTLRSVRHITLDEIGRRIAMGGFQELNIIVKGDVDGSIEALSDSLIKLSTPEIQVNVIHKGVGQITEGDISLAAASNAIVVGFNVRPTSTARHLAEQEQIDIRLYSIIYQAIDEVKAAMEGMLLPEKSEKITATLEVRETFHIGKVGTIAGCAVKEGKIKRNSKIRLIRDGIVVCTSEIESLKHEKDDVKEVSSGYECGLNIANYNDVKVGDIIEAYEEIEVKKTL